MTFVDRYRWFITLLLMAFILMGGAVFLYRQTPLSASSEITIIPPSRDIRVHVDGEVVSPGVYKLEQGDLVCDAVEAAGGFSPEADSGAVNLAAIMRDGEQIHVYKMGEVPQRININTAEAWLLQALPGIGETIARRVIDYRSASGDFQCIDDLKQVEGIGPAVFEQMKDKVTVR